MLALKEKLQRMRKMTPQLAYKMLKPPNVQLFDPSNVSTKFSENDHEAAELSNTPMHSNSREEEKKEIFDDNAKNWIRENWHFCSANGPWSPRRSPIKIKKKVIKKKLKVVPRSRKAAWMVNHLQAMRALVQEDKVQDKPIDMDLSLIHI